MKVSLESLPVKELRQEREHQKQNVAKKGINSNEDIVTISSSKNEMVAEENRTASNSGISELNRIEQDILLLQRKILSDANTAAGSHQLNIDTQLFVALS